MWGGSNVPPSKPLRTGARIGSCLGWGQQMQLAERTASKVGLGVEVGAVVTKGEVHCLLTVGPTRATDGLPPLNSLPSDDPDR